MLQPHRTIFIVNGLADERKYYRQSLLQETTFDYLILEEPDIESGLDLCQSYRPDIVILSLALPELKGLAFLEKLLAQTPSWGLTPPVITIVDCPNHLALTQIEAAGADVILVRGQLTASELRFVVRGAIEKADLRKALMNAKHQFKGQFQQLTQLLMKAKANPETFELANDSSDEILTMVVNRLRSPLRSILGWANLLRTHTVDPETADRVLESIEYNAQDQSQLITELLDISYLINGKLKLNLVPVNLTTIIETALATARALPEARHHHLEFQCATSKSYVLGDADRLQQIFWNLLSNAIKFTPPEGRILVRLSPVIPQKLSREIINPNDEQAWVQITVSDTGQGISPDFLPYVFDQFSQAEGLNSSSRGGLGLGLTIVQHLVTLHQGTVSASSPGHGQGATFTVQLPLLANILTLVPDQPNTKIYQSSGMPFRAS